MNTATIEQATGAGPDHHLSFPEISVAIGVSLDRVRREMLRNPALSGLSRKVGQMRIVRAADLERIREIFTN